MQEILSKLRAVTDEDRGRLLTTSFSKFDTFSTCQRRYMLNYEKGLRTESATLPLELGSILHKGLEMKGNYLITGKEVDYETIQKTVMDGCDEISEKDTKHLYGVNEIKNRYPDVWFGSLEDEANKSYSQKILTYLNEVLPTRMEDKEWVVKGTEIPFEFVYDNRCIIHGFIDRVDEKVKNNDDKTILKVIDYKSSKKVFMDAKIKTPLQMIIYDLACLFIYGVIPEYHEYDFILLNKKQTTEDGVCTRGYLKRGLKKIDTILDKIDQAKKENEYSPSPTPLCYWCPYPDKLHTVNADEKYGGECQYYSLWKPEHKVFEVNQEYIPGEEKPKRRLVF